MTTDGNIDRTELYIEDGDIYMVYLEITYKNTLRREVISIPGYFDIPMCKDLSEQVSLLRNTIQKEAKRMEIEYHMKRLWELGGADQ